jgi:N-acetyl-anhydromuramyl-L-alanine amidase AmpD
VVDVDGTIYEVFPPRFWAYHLGVKGGTPHERRSIGIEIVNVGPLQLCAEDATRLNWWPPGNSWKTRYCGLDEPNRYVKATYREKQYFAAFPDAQIDAVAGLVAQVCDEFEIPRVLPGPEDRLECNPAKFAGFRGIATHANFRPDKWDIGPAFSWDRLRL